MMNRDSNAAPDDRNPRCRPPALLLAALAVQAEPPPTPASGTFAEAAVAADHPAAAEAGAEVLRAGGNAVDAAVAISLSLSVVRPYSCGIGGGGFLVFWDAEAGEAHAVDYRERAPAAATRDMFAGDPDAARRGGKAVAVPGTVAGLHAAHAKWGELPWATVCGPAVRLAGRGVPLDAHDRAQREEFVARFERTRGLKTRYPAFWNDYLFGGTLPTAGEARPSPQAGLLNRIAAEGPAAFYFGPSADALADAVRDAGGVLTAADLAAYEPRFVEPLRGSFGGYDLVAMPPPSSGGVAMIETLNVLSAYERGRGRADLRAAGGRHVLVEALKHAFADRAAFLGDPYAAADAGSPLPTDRLISTEYAAELAAKIDPARTFPPRLYGRVAPVEDGGTSHFSIIDAAGNAVACTETVNLVFGSLVVVPETGVLLNDQMDDFAAVPGEPNAFGLIQGEANAVGPGRVPLSSMSPTVVLEDGRAVLAVGASGGPRIITATLQVLLNRVRHGMTPAAAVAAPRLHHQWVPDRVEVEPGLFAEVRAELAPLGHDVRERAGIGVAQAVAVEPDGARSAAADPRKGGGVAGY